MHPRGGPAPWTAARGRQVRTLLEFVRARAAVHPREVDAHFSHGTVTNYWGGSSNATTHLLDAMHYRGLLRVVRREAGIRIYAAHEHPPVARDAVARRAHLDALVDVVVSKYAPLPSASLSTLVRRLRYAAPQWTGQLSTALQRAKRRLAHTRIEGVDWYWPATNDSVAPETGDVVRLLAPFDPVVWDRRRFEILWGWAYRFEAYTPVPRRKLGYYALPLLWRDRVIGWANVSVTSGRLQARFGYVASRPRGPVFRTRARAGTGSSPPVSRIAVTVDLMYSAPQIRLSRMENVMNAARLIFAVGLLVASTTIAYAQGGQDFSKVEIKATKVTDKFYTLEGQGGTIGVLIGPDGVFMVDTQFAPLSDKIAAAIKQLTPQPIKFVVNTHLHGDHSGGDVNFAKMGATIIAREELRFRLAHPNPQANGQPGVPMDGRRVAEADLPRKADASHER